jgi:hypothetical protein
VVVLVVGALTFTGCAETAGEELEVDQSTTSTVIRKDRVSAQLPAGWSEIKEPISNIVEPSPLFAVASEPVEVDSLPRGCNASAAVDQLSSSGALVSVLGTAPQRLPSRPAEIKLNRSTYANYECAGPSHQVAFHQNDRGVYVNVWFDPDRVDPVVRRQAVAFVNSLELRDFPSRECNDDYGVDGLEDFEGVDGLSCGEAALLWKVWAVPPTKLNRCTRTGSDHSVRVTDGITCGVAERFILGGTKGFAPHPGGWIERADRFTCRIRDFNPRSNPGLYVDCLDTDRGPSGPRFTFRFY